MSEGNPAVDGLLRRDADSGARAEPDSRRAALPDGLPQERSDQGTATTDGDGRLTSDGKNKYAWEAQGWLCAVAAPSGGAYDYYQYVYDATGGLITIANRTVANNQCDLNINPAKDFVLDQQGHQVAEVDGYGTGRAWEHSNVFANGELLATYDANGTHFAFGDWLGTKRLQATVTTAGVSVDESCWNLPFNDSFGCSGSVADATEHHYTGKMRDNNTGLDHPIGAAIHGTVDVKGAATRNPCP